MTKRAQLPANERLGRGCRSPSLPTVDRGSKSHQTAMVVRSYGHIITRVHDCINTNT